MMNGYQHRREAQRIDALFDKPEIMAWARSLPGWGAEGVPDPIIVEDVP